MGGGVRSPGGSPRRSGEPSVSGVVHIVEPGGRGGVFQHAVSLAEHLTRLGLEVVVHTAADAEALPGQVPRRPCFWRFPSVRPKLLRQSLFVAGWLVRGVPSCLVPVSPGDVVHIEGRFKPVLLIPLVQAARFRRCTLTFTPHTTSSRAGRASEDVIARWVARQADAVVALSEYDRRRVEAWGVTAVPMPLLVSAPSPAPALVADWRQRWGAEAGRPVVLLAGQLRADKGPDLLVRAVASMGGRAVVAMAGEDLGAVREVRKLAAELGVSLVVDEGYLPLDRFVAAVAAADVVACPYRVGGQSAVLALAHALGRPTVATNVGGLPELASVVVEPEDPAALAQGIEEALRTTTVPPVRRPPAEALAPFLAASGLRAEESTPVPTQG